MRAKDSSILTPMSIDPSEKYNGPFDRLPLEIIIRIIEILVEGENFTSLQDFYNFSQCQKKLANIYHAQALGNILKEFVNRSFQPLFKKNVDLFYCYLDEQKNINYTKFIQDFISIENCKTDETLNSVLDLMGKHINPIIFHIYLKKRIDILENVIQAPPSPNSINQKTNFKPGDKNKMIISHLSKQILIAHSNGNNVAIFMMSYLLNNEILNSFQNVYLDHFLQYFDKTNIDELQISINEDLFKQIFDNQIPDNCDLIIEPSWAFSFTQEFVKIKKLYRQFTEWGHHHKPLPHHACLTLASAANPVALYEYISNNSLHSLLMTNSNLAKNLLPIVVEYNKSKLQHLSEFLTKYTKKMYKYTSGTVYENKIINFIKILFSSADYEILYNVLDQDLLPHLVEKNELFIKYLALLTGKELNLHIQLFWNFCSKNEISLGFHIFVYIKYHQIFDTENHNHAIIHFLKNLLNIDDFFEKNCTSPNHLKNLFSSTYLLDKTHDALKYSGWERAIYLLSVDYELFNFFADPKNEGILNYYIQTSSCQTYEYLLALKNQAKLFLDGTVTPASYRDRILGLRRRIFDEFPGKFDLWTAEEVKQFFCLGKNRKYNSIFKGDELKKIISLFTYCTDNLKFEQIKSLAESRVFRLEKIDQNFVIIFATLGLNKLEELYQSDTGKALFRYSSELKPQTLQTLLQLTQQDKTNLTCLLKSNIFDLFKRLDNYDNFIFMYNKFGLNGLEELYRSLNGLFLKILVMDKQKLEMLLTNSNNELTQFSKNAINTFTPNFTENQANLSKQLVTWLNQKRKPEELPSSIEEDCLKMLKVAKKLRVEHKEEEANQQLEQMIKTARDFLDQHKVTNSIPRNDGI